VDLQVAVTSKKSRNYVSEAARSSEKPRIVKDLVKLGVPELVELRTAQSGKAIDELVEQTYQAAESMITYDQKYSSESMHRKTNTNGFFVAGHI
jgi:hypothetical protein